MIIEHHADQRPSSRLSAAVGQAWIINERSVPADKNRVVFVSKVVNAFQGSFTGKSSRNASIQRNPSIQRHRELQVNKWPLLLMPADKLLVLFRSFIGKNAGDNFDSGISQTLKSPTGNKRIWIFNRTNDAFYPCVYQSLGTRSSSALVIVRFEGNVRRAASGLFSCLFESNSLGVDDIVVNVTSLAENRSIFRNNDAADERIGADKANPE